MWWVTTRGGVWHTGHLVAIILAMLMLAELFGKQRAVLLGLLVGASFLTRAPVAFAGPALALWYWLLAKRDGEGTGVGAWIARIPWRQWLLLGFGTQMWWVTTRGGVWHTGHLIAIILAMLMLAELFGKQRAFLVGLLVGASFLTRAPVAFAGPALALWYWLLAAREGEAGGVRAWISRIPWRQWLLLILGFLPGLAVFFAYNAARFGSPLESGSALATLPDWLEALRQQGLFSPVHIPMNLNYLFLHLPIPASSPPYLRPDGLGMSVFLTSPGLLLFLLAPWRDRRTWALAAAAVLVLIPTLLYYGGGWFQFGYRYFLDSIPFVWALAAMGIAVRGGIRWWGWLLILWGVLMGAYGVWWTYHL
jgi:hypothetical protein